MRTRNNTTYHIEDLLSNGFIFKMIFVILCNLAVQSPSFSCPTDIILSNSLSYHKAHQDLHKDIPSSVKLLGEFEIELEDDNNDDCKHKENSTEFTLYFPEVKVFNRGISSYLDTKSPKLYILFHSWKSYLSL